MEAEKQYRERDFVVDLITGKMVTMRNKKTGETTVEFTASRPNKYPPISRVAAAYPALSLDDILIKENLRNRRMELDPTICEKDEVAKEDLKYHKNAHRAYMRSVGVDPNEQINA